ncbi:DUF4910 domain-containing protein [Lachnotalea glycerini]|nr:DUF4910 domain-containing protein [Lachnotalea glycerini]
MYQLAARLFPICRSITGKGTRETLEIIKEILPMLHIENVASGTEVFDWTIPNEWNVFEAYIEDESGKRIIDFKDNNLYVMGYSSPVDRFVNLEELKKYVYTQEDQPDVIPYVTTYYKKRFGFCMEKNRLDGLRDGIYHMVVKSELKPGYLTYGELVISGETEEEIFLSTYICHPSMANNELSGPCVAVQLAKWLMGFEKRRYTYRIIFIPETIGSITYLSKNIDKLKKNVVAGFNLSCVGDDRTYSYVASRYGNTLADKIAVNVLRFHYPQYKSYTFLDRGSDERQYCAPGIDLPLCAICRSKYGDYPEYHTSADNLELISPNGLQGAYEVYKKCITALEYNRNYMVQCLCEPQLGKRGLYPDISKKGTYGEIQNITNFIAYADGQNDLIDISNITNISIEKLIPIVIKLLQEGLIAEK